MGHDIYLTELQRRTNGPTSCSSQQSLALWVPGKQRPSAPAPHSHPSTAAEQRKPPARPLHEQGGQSHKSAKISFMISNYFESLYDPNCFSEPVTINFLEIQCQGKNKVI